MDPNLFHLDYGRTFEVLLTIVVLAMIVERTLSILFEKVVDCLSTLPRLIICLTHHQNNF